MRRATFVAWLAMACSLSLLGGMPSQAKGPPVVLAVIVANDSPVNGLTSHELKRLYLGEGVSDGRGTKLIPLSQSPRSPDRIGFDRTALGMTPEEVTRYWIERKIRGKSGPPKSIDSPELLQRVVTRLDGALGYVRSGDTRSDIKTVKIDGKLPGDPGYALVY